MKTTYYAHLPGVTLAGLDEVVFAQGRLTCLSFDDWQQLDGAFRWTASTYEQSRPVFYTWQTDSPEDQDPGVEVSEWLPPIHLAFLLAPNTPLLPDPRMSAIYVRTEFSAASQIAAAGIGFQTVRLIGAFEREWIVFGNRTSAIFDRPAIAQVNSLWRFLSVSLQHTLYPGIDGCIQTLRLTAHPEFWWPSHEWDDQQLNAVNSFVHCVGALESILVPGKGERPGHKTITQLFGEHAAVLADSSRDDLQRRTLLFSAVYRLRSRLIHGELGIADLDDSEHLQLKIARPLLRSAILAGLALGQTMIHEESLWQMLQFAYSDPEAHRKLADRLHEQGVGL